MCVKLCISTYIVGVSFLTVSHVRTQKHKNADFCPEQFPRTGRRVPHSRHQSARLVACGDGVYDVTGGRKIGSEALDFRHFSASGSFEQVETVNALRELIYGGTVGKMCEG